jgi:hypothetical protein
VKTGAWLRVPIAKKTHQYLLTCLCEEMILTIFCMNVITYCDNNRCLTCWVLCLQYVFITPTIIANSYSLDGSSLQLGLWIPILLVQSSSFIPHLYYSFPSDAGHTLDTASAFCRSPHCALLLRRSVNKQLHSFPLDWTEHTHGDLY